MNYVKLQEDLIRDEGLKLRRYLCPAGCPTIGVGHKIVPRDGDMEWVSLRRAGSLLEYDIAMAMEGVEDIFESFPSFSENRQRALINMMFNLGTTRFKMFVKMISAIAAEDWAQASEEIRESRYYRQVGPRAERTREAVLHG